MAIWQKCPHLLIAGTTGSGKSVCTNSIIMSLLYRCSPQTLRMILIDPKMVEFAQYNGIPHLLMPVVTEPRKAAGALGSAVAEMEKRYHLLAENGVPNIEEYNALAEENAALEKMPYIVIVIDELADLMMVAGKEVEDYICRIAQKGARCRNAFDHCDTASFCGCHYRSDQGKYPIAHRTFGDEPDRQPDDSGYRRCRKNCWGMATCCICR